jgi:heme exporter protein CcmD
MFVWPAYFIAVLVIVAILIRPWRRQRKFLRLKSAELKRQQGGPSSIEEVN